MLEYLLFGAGYAFAAAVQPGPLQAFLLSQAAQKGWKRTLPASVAPVLSDAPIAVLALLFLSRVPSGMAGALQIAGGILLLYLAVGAYRQAKRPEPAASEKTPGTLLKAVAVNILNPNPYLGWTLVLGPEVLKAWNHRPMNALALIVAFYGTMVAALAAIILLFSTARLIRAHRRRILVLVSALVLALLGGYQVAAGLRSGRAWMFGVRGSLLKLQIPLEIRG